jgi:hypothetical protein
MLLSLCVIKHHTTKAYGVIGVECLAFLTSPLDRDQRWALEWGSLISRTVVPGAHWIGGHCTWRASLDSLGKSISCCFCRRSNNGYSIWHSWDRASLMYFLSIANKMQRYTIFFIIVNALHVSGGFSAHHQELKNCTHSIGGRNRLKHVEHWQ